MKLVFRLGLALIPLIFFLSQTAYSAGFRSHGPRGHRGVPDLNALSTLSPASAVPITVSSATAARNPASGTYAHQSQRRARPDECTGLTSVKTPSSIAVSPAAEWLSENTLPAPPHEGSGIGAQTTVFHFE